MFHQLRRGDVYVRTLQTSSERVIRFYYLQAKYVHAAVCSTGGIFLNVKISHFTEFLGASLHVNLKENF